MRVRLVCERRDVCRCHDAESAWCRHVFVSLCGCVVVLGRRRSRLRPKLRLVIQAVLHLVQQPQYASRYKLSYISCNKLGTPDDTTSVRFVVQKRGRMGFASKARLRRPKERDNDV